MKHFTIICGKKTFSKWFNDESEARHWCINTLDQSNDIVLRETYPETLDYLDSHQKSFLKDLINEFSGEYYCKGTLMKLSECTSNCDSALPINAIKAIQEVMPDFKSQFHFMDYRTNTFGSVNNVAEQLIEKMHEIFKR